MAMGIVSADEFEQELIRLGLSDKSERGPKDPRTPNLNQVSESKSEIEVIPINHGRGIGKKEISHEIRSEIAQLATNGVRASELSNSFNISPSSISAYKNGATSTASYNNPDQALSKHVRTIKDILLSKARTKLDVSLDNMTDEKLSGAKIRDLAAIARDMAAVVKNMEPTEVQDTGIKTQVIIYQPRIKDEQDFEIIDATHE